MVKVVALIDGEHHPAVVREALGRLATEEELAGVLFVGGEEKLGEGILDDPVSHYGREVVIAKDDPEGGLRALAVDSGLEAVIDLSGEPVLDPRHRFRIASVALHLGLEYRSAGLRLAPPPRERLAFEGPVLEVIGTGKRTGKTAVAGHYAFILRERGIEPVIVSMGRGGPPEPQVVHAEARPDLAALRAIVRAGGHAASDYLEDAVLSGVSCVGCRRCGEGLAGETFQSNALDGAALAVSLEPDVLLVEGSGATVPPIAADRTVCVTSAARAEDALSYLGPYRLLGSDLTLITGADSVSRAQVEELKRSLGRWCGGASLIACRFEPEPAAPVPPGARVALLTTASVAHEAQLRERLARQGIDVVLVSGNLARRSALRSDLARAERERCDIYLTELKAAAIEVVAEDAELRGVEVVFLRNRPLALEDEPDLDAALLELLADARLVAAGADAAGAARG